LPFHELAVAPADVSGGALGLALNAPAPDPLATCRVIHPGGGVLVLGVLGASHVVTVEHGAQRFSEQVSCTARANGGELPERADAPGYQLDSRVRIWSDVAIRWIARRLRERCATEEHWLGGAFPGDDAALTVLSAAPDGGGWRWQSWHLYPESAGGTEVYTASRWRP
jgi:hypothetical protein